MQNPSQVCGNCGKPVADSDVTCPHCDVLLAAYASPAGSTSPHAYESSEPIADAVPEAEMYVPDPAPPVTIPDQVEVVSTAPRPLFDTKLTVEEISKAAEGEHEESLVVVSEEKMVTKPAVFDTPDYAKPPSDAKPVDLVDGGDEDLIARSAEEPTAVAAPEKKIEPVKEAAPPQPVENHAEPREVADDEDDAESDRQAVTTPASTADNRPSYSVPPARETVATVEADEQETRGESWLYDLTRNAPEAAPRKPKRERTDRPQPVRTTTKAPGKRGTTESYLQKLHAEAGYVSDNEQLSQPVDTHSSRRGSTAQQAAAVKSSRQGCFAALYLSTGILWVLVLVGLVSGAPNGTLIFWAIVLTAIIQQKNKILGFMERS